VPASKDIPPSVNVPASIGRLSGSPVPADIVPVAGMGVASAISVEV
jgi:hypothetical protein